MEKRLHIQNKQRLRQKQQQQQQQRNRVICFAFPIFSILLLLLSLLLQDSSCFVFFVRLLVRLLLFVCMYVFGFFL